MNKRGSYVRPACRIGSNRQPYTIYFAVLRRCGVGWIRLLYRSDKIDHFAKVYAVPLATAIFIFAHDLSFLVYYDKWFNQYGHWWCKAWWFVLLITVPLEMLLIYFVARYGRAETFPFLKQKGFTVLVILATVGLSVFGFS